MASETVDFGYEGMGDDLEALEAALPKPRKVTTVDLGGNKITDQGCVKLAQLLGRCKQLKDLDLRDNKIGEGIGEVAKVIQTLPVHALRLDENPLRDYGATVCVHLMKHCKTLRELELTNTFIGINGMNEIADALSRSDCRLARLSVAFNRVGDDGVARLGKALQTCPSLKELDVSDNALTDSGCVALAAGLASPKCKLESFNISVNNISPEGATALADALSRGAKCLRRLDVGNNPIESAGATAIASAIKNPNSLVSEVHFTMCVLDDSCAPALLDLVTTKKIEFLEVDMNEEFSEDNMKQIKAATKANKKSREATETAKLPTASAAQGFALGPIHFVVLGLIVAIVAALLYHVS